MVCSKCGKSQDQGAVEGKRHRRCGGVKGADLKGKRLKLPKGNRGLWTK